MDTNELEQLRGELHRVDGKNAPITTMPFGKHKGTHLKDLSKPYLVWALSNLPKMRSELRAALLTELRSRGASSTSKKTITTMPFGKYKGEALVDLPESYINWLLSNCELRADVRQALEKVLE